MRGRRGDTCIKFYSYLTCATNPTDRRSGAGAWDTHNARSNPQALLAELVRIRVSNLTLERFIFSTIAPAQTAAAAGRISVLPDSASTGLLASVRQRALLASSKLGHHHQAHLRERRLSYVTSPAFMCFRSSLLLRAASQSRHRSTASNCRCKYFLVTRLRL